VWAASQTPGKKGGGMAPRQSWDDRQAAVKGQECIGWRKVGGWVNLLRYSLLAAAGNKEEETVMK